MLNKKIKLDFIIVVEGKTDTIHLQKLFDVQTIETNGSRVSKFTLNLIKDCIDRHLNLVFLLDPDAQGTKIRNLLNSNFKNVKNVFIQKSDMQKNSKKIGVAECKDDILIKLLKKVDFKQINAVSDLIWQDFLDFDILFNQTYKQKIFTFYHLPLVNNKTLFKYLKMLNVTKEELRHVITSN